MKYHLILFSIVFFTLFIITISPKTQALDPDLALNYWQTYPVEGEFVHSAKSMQIVHQEFRIPYKITNGTLETIVIDQKLNSIITELKGTSSGTFDIVIPRNLLDKKNDNQDAQFIIIAEGEETGFTETSTDCSRNLSIKFKDGTKQIEIIGTTIPSQDFPIGHAPNLMTEVYPVHVTTDMSFYAENYPILISGCTSLAFPNDVISLDIFSHEKKTHTTYEITPAGDGTFDLSPSLSAGIFTISATFHNATDSVNIGVMDGVEQSSIGQGPRPIRPDIKEIPLPEDIRKTMHDTCSHMSDLTKEEKQFWETLHVRLVGDTPEFKSLDGIRGSLNITSGISATSCPPITGIDGTFISENGMKHKFQLGYDGNNFQYQIDAIFPPQYKEKTPSPLKQFKSGTPSQYVNCNDGLELLIKASNGQPICVKPSTKAKLLYIKWAEPTRILG